MQHGGRAAAVQPVVKDLQRIFADRLHAVVAYGWRQHGPVPSLALTESISIDDLRTCAECTRAWHRAGAATPLLVTTIDFARSLDAFPIEYGEILAHHHVVFGSDPFTGMTISRDDLRRACEVQVKSHLLHLREDYLEGSGHPAAVDLLVRESAPGFAALLRQLARLDDGGAATHADLGAYAARIGLAAHLVGDLLSLADPDGVTAVDAGKIFPAYLEAVEHLARFVDRWHTP